MSETDSSKSGRAPRGAEARAEQKDAQGPGANNFLPRLTVKEIVGKLLNFLTKLSPKK